MENNGHKTETDGLEELKKKYDQERNEQRKKRELENPDGRVSGAELEELVSAVAGIRNQVNGTMVEEGLAQKRFDKNRKFATKLVKNFRVAKNELEVIRAICPQYPEDLKAQIQDYTQKRLNMAKVNAGIPEDKQVQQVTVAQVKEAGNYELFQAELESLNQSYHEALTRKEQIDNKTQEIMNRPLAKPDFDMVTECEIPGELSPAEISAIWPMVSKEGC